MDVLALYLGAAFVGGLVARLVKLPPLVGFLAVGFTLGATGAPELPGIATIAEIGVSLLLFTIGLKLDVRSFTRPEIWLTTVSHMLLSTLVGIGFLGLLAVAGAALLGGEGLLTLALVGFALSFSSTVFVIKVLEDRSDATSLYGRIAVGILVMQDVAAVAFLVIATGEPPSPWALLLLLLVPGRRLLHLVWDRVGHGELQAMFGVTLALGPGYFLFEHLGLSGGLGALVMGVLLASHPGAGEMSRSLMSFKDLMLVAFFLEIGLHGTPTPEHVLMAAGLLVLLPVQAAGFALLLWTLRLRRRTAILTGLVLGNFSEFGIIVAAVGADAGMLDPDWLIVISLAVAMSFVLASVVNRRGVEIASALTRYLPAKPPSSLHPDDRVVDIGHADALVLGLGRVGMTACARLRDEHGLDVVGVEHDDQRVAALQQQGFEVVRADATDLEFWARVKRAGHVRLAVLAMPFHNANLIALSRLQESGFDGLVAAIARYDDDAAELRRHGADAVFHLYGAAGAELADRAAEVLAADG
ncbi:transporter (CPA2 family) [Isoptericola sp. CG 20/1183]|uniref:Transporter (CPA2 family) n=1 Tax=Isoptericola halotolerans TaxID=300560 RepID=A0ABX5EBM1_9MICO|nr:MULTISPECIES: cation:proton antiporter family protein [Isoptericola]MCK0118710.1 cation:proton antiporter [Isoptericola sp. S6320L]PRZ04902.1 transporter (CPA2 family) [Isoptericola halotolerans]PRZ05393.1 transporter (CPA2 family) [Isoptericola sp. CG 20/1183]